jgi:transcriptional regulator with XRE-family HTH domain
MTFPPNRSPGDNLPRNSMMEEAGQKLKRSRERLDLKYRDVEEATSRIAEAHRNDEFIVQISRLSDIENKGTIPNMYRLYSLCVVYRLEMAEVLAWYDIALTKLVSDTRLVEHAKTHPLGFKPQEDAEVQVPLTLDPGIDLSQTMFLSRMIQKWGRVPLMLLARMDLRSRLYAMIGTEDWSMFPIIPPGSLVVIDDTRRRISPGGWKTEFERPIYFLEHRKGYACCWCSLREGVLTLHPHPSSQREPQSFKCPSDIEVIGQVIHVAMTVDPSQRRRSPKREAEG